MDLVGIPTILRKTSVFTPPETWYGFVSSFTKLTHCTLYKLFERIMSLMKSLALEEIRCLGRRLACIKKE
ncbi:hypothetical protein LEP1GSC103_0681 [Leptospira borgpetersenii serovar Javanica str. UI 09931]|uniref:Uncharacterized protein n=3 Tax=Leptospira borgpetersenii TaxID=174 RepID=M3F754_LEPBO|nr:hypothetical protein LBBP_04291 [Leptospira borgpetersenii serovar Ballum]EKQ91515.1 hypothetical protein LEP1GSC101_1154 [Leptospira borgpetersenii str. UI 09149]EKQ98186.1 hypothetical protein LEP1GSC121_0078 [Leptospira borgpetersenii serovar Castellonis str. 200801910]EMF97802.1 hypothetical protein LEP1GSC123_0940 [Leptospira borgpetersenii str. 200701203]EMN58733.1 hypothetical protein LEP1GSC090_2702 [Leptospira borgpetersenii serovar Javanica str. MK146]ENO62790.1 hypothetical prote